MFFLRYIYNNLEIFDREYCPSGNSNSLFHVGAAILNLLFLYDFFYIFPRIVNAKF